MYITQCIIQEQIQYSSSLAQINNDDHNINLSRATDWATLVGRHDLASLPREYLNKNCHICSRHFDMKMLNADKTRLLHHAMPTVMVSAISKSDSEQAMESKHMMHGGIKSGTISSVQTASETWSYQSGKSVV